MGTVIYIQYHLYCVPFRVRLEGIQQQYENVLGVLVANPCYALF